MHRAADGRFISFFGDLHPSFFGNVVKAMGGAKRGYPVVSRACSPRARRPPVSGAALIARCRDELGRAGARGAPADARPSSRWWCARPAAARAFRPGQFYRLQNYEMLAPRLAEPGGLGPCWRWRAWR